MPDFIFNNWESIARTLIVGTGAYAAMVFLLRISGKRTLSKMNAFDFIVTVALGSTLATSLLSKDTALAQAAAAFALLIGLQLGITWLSVRSNRFQRLIKAEPRLLFHRGQFLRGVMRAERVIEEEIYAAIRAQGIARLDQVEAVVLETDGSFTILQRPQQGQTTTLQYVSNNPHDQQTT